MTRKAAGGPLAPQGEYLVGERGEEVLLVATDDAETGPPRHATPQTGNRAPLGPEPGDPMALLARWVADGGITDLRGQEQPMVLATTGNDGPDARVLLLRGLEAGGLVFFTNYSSAKGQQLTNDERACAVIHWPGEYAEPGQVGQRQARIRGRVLRLPAAGSDAYFAGRPLDHQLGAWLSAQSRPAAGWRWAALRVAVRVRRLGVRLAPRATGWALRRRVRRPGHWGGYLLLADRVELWEGRPSRLHERQVWTRGVDGWQVGRVMP